MTPLPCLAAGLVLALVPSRQRFCRWPHRPSSTLKTVSLITRELPRKCYPTSCTLMPPSIRSAGTVSTRLVRSSSKTGIPTVGMPLFRPRRRPTATTVWPTERPTHYVNPPRFCTLSAIRATTVTLLAVTVGTAGTPPAFPVTCTGLLRNMWSCSPGPTATPLIGTRLGTMSIMRTARSSTPLLVRPMPVPVV